MTFTTPADFELFKKECRKWIDRLSLDEWKFTFYQEKINSNADCTSSIIDKNIVIRLAKTIEIENRTKRECIKSLAQHEVLHSLLEGLYHQARDRAFCHDDYLMAEHCVIHRLQKAFKEK